MVSEITGNYRIKTANRQFENRQIKVYLTFCIGLQCVLLGINNKMNISIFNWISTYIFQISG